MSKFCSHCSKGPSTGSNISHSMRHTNRRFEPNLQTKSVGGKRVKICTSCIRTLSKARV